MARFASSTPRYAINLEKRVRSDHPLRRVAAALDFGFVREAVAHCYGRNGQVSVDPERSGTGSRLKGVLLKASLAARDSDR